MGKGYNNYMTKKPFHPGSKANIKRTWMAEQRAENEKKKQDELKSQYEKEQDLYSNRALLSTESKDKLELNFMYEAPPGAKRERQKEDDEPEYKFEWQRKYNAPREDYAKGNADIRDQPFGIPVRNVRCIKCHKWGHINTDRECPLFSHASASSMPTTTMDPLELMRQMREDGYNLKQSALGRCMNPKQSNQQLIASDESDPEMEFLRTLSADQKRKLLKKLNKLSKKQKMKEKCKKKKSKKKQKKISIKKDSSSSESDSSSSESEAESHHKKLMPKKQSRTDSNEELHHHKKLKSEHKSQLKKSQKQLDSDSDESHRHKRSEMNNDKELRHSRRLESDFESRKSEKQPKLDLERPHEKSHHKKSKFDKVSEKKSVKPIENTRRNSGYPESDEKTKNSSQKQESDTDSDKKSRHRKSLESKDDYKSEKHSKMDRESCRESRHYRGSDSKEKSKKFSKRPMSDIDSDSESPPYKANKVKDSSRRHAYKDSRDTVANRNYTEKNRHYDSKKHCSLPDTKHRRQC